jgi:glyceraldehyde 3-phosphate dehydrogenase
LLNRKTTKDEINQAFIDASKSPRYAGILTVSSDPLVSSDIVGNSSSCIVDLGLTDVVDGDFAKIIAWYDNEWGYSNRLIEEVIFIGQSV